MEKQRDFFIDFLKGIAIIFVLFCHNLPESVMKWSVFVLWGSMAVPIFLALQSYHVFKAYAHKKELSLRNTISIKKIWRRIMKPYVVLTVISGLLLVLSGKDIVQVVKSTIVAGGIGPGSYYVWVYLQFTLLLPICLTLFNRMGGGILTCLIFILLCQTIEWICMLIDLPEPIYRLSCLRYLFLIYLGYVWTTNRMARTLTKKQIIIGLLSALALVMLFYSNISVEPFLYDTAWRVHHWIGYFWAALLLPWLIWKFYYRLPTTIRAHICEIGKWSYEIFLLQMFVFTFYPHSLMTTNNRYIDFFLFVIISISLSVFPVFAWKKYACGKSVLK